MKPTIDTFKEWIEKYMKECCLKHLEYTQEDIDALGECFSIYLGDFDIKSVKSGKELKEVFLNFPEEIIQMDKYCATTYKRNDEIIFDYRHAITGNNFRHMSGHCCSINKKFENYSFSIWHCSWNNQIMLDKKGFNSYIRIQWNDLFNAIYDYFDDSVEFEQLSFF